RPGKHFDAALPLVRAHLHAGAGWETDHGEHPHRAVSGYLGCNGPQPRMLLSAVAPTVRVVREMERVGRAGSPEIRSARPGSSRWCCAPYRPGGVACSMCRYRVNEELHVTVAAQTPDEA